MQDKIVIHGARAHNLKKYRCGNSTGQISRGDGFVWFWKVQSA